MIPSNGKPEHWLFGTCDFDLFGCVSRLSREMYSKYVPLAQSHKEAKRRILSAANMMDASGSGPETNKTRMRDSERAKRKGNRGI